MLVFLFVLVVGNYSQDRISLDNKAYADGQSLISVFYDGQKKTVATSANTVGEALDKMGVKLSEGDVTEPALDQPLSPALTNINVYRARPYLIVDGQTKVTVKSGWRSPRKVVEQAGLPIYPEDNVTTERVDQFLQESMVGQQLVIERAKPVVIVLAGKTFNVRTQAKTVAELFVEKKLDIKDKDVVRTPLNSQLYAGMKIVVSRLGQRIAVEEQAVEQDVQYVTDNAKPVGFSEVRDPGKPGKKQVSFLLTEEDGVEQQRQLLEEKVLEQPVTKVVVIGPVSVTAKYSHSSSADGWAKLRQCESGGNYANKNNPLYRGAYQFAWSTWGNYGGYRDPADAPPEVQDAKAQELYARSGSSPWPMCGRYLR